MGWKARLKPPRYSDSSSLQRISSEYERREMPLSQAAEDENPYVDVVVNRNDQTGVTSKTLARLSKRRQSSSTPDPSDSISPLRRRDLAGVSVGLGHDRIEFCSRLHSCTWLRGIFEIGVRGLHRIRIQRGPVRADAAERSGQIRNTCSAQMLPTTPQRHLSSVSVF